MSTFPGWDRSSGSTRLARYSLRISKKYKSFWAESFIILVLCSLWSVTTGQRLPSPLACAAVHAAAFAVNAALVASKWQHRAWSVPMHPPMGTEHEAGQEQEPFCKSSVRPDRESNPACQHYWRVLNQLGCLRRISTSLFSFKEHVNR